jgi:hypothetical protein
MGADIYKARYKFVFGPITGEQFDFINDIIYRSDDGTYELNGEHYLEFRQKIGELEKLYKTDLRPLFRMFEKETKNGKGHLSFRVFA